MELYNLLNNHLHINSVSDDNGRTFYNLQVCFSEEDILNIYRNSIEELLEDLPQILVSAIRARIVREQFLI